MDAFLTQLRSDGCLRELIDRHLLCLDKKKGALAFYPPLPPKTRHYCDRIWKKVSIDQRRCIFRDIQRSGGVIRIDDNALDWFECEHCFTWFPVAPYENVKHRRCCALCTEALSVCASLE